MKTHVICIKPNGESKALYSDDLQPYMQGIEPCTVKRVGEVEFDNEAGGWTVCMAGTGERLSGEVFSERATALKKEIAVLTQRLPLL